MIKRIYIDNYKTLVNFELSIGEINLFLGPNGSGKSSVFEVLQKIKAFTGGVNKVTDLFTINERTRWQNSMFQSFELEIGESGDSYKYELSIDFDPNSHQAQVKYEHLYFNNRPLLIFETGNVHLSTNNQTKSYKYPFDPSLSAVAAIPLNKDNIKVTVFKEWLARFIIVQVIPVLMKQESHKEQPLVTRYFDNFVSWYRHVSQDQGIAFEITSELRKILPGFEYFKFEPVGEEHRLLNVYYSDEEKGTVKYNFGELSDGQRMIIALYSLLFAARAEKKRSFTLCLDEPENFLALPEIQPWLTELYDLCSEEKIQALLISHHPELINYLLASPVGYWFERKSNRPTRVSRISVDEKVGLTIAELITRGWLHG